MSFDPPDRAQLAAVDKRTSVDIANVLNDPLNGVVVRLGRVEKALSDLAAAVAKLPTTAGGQAGSPEAIVKAFGEKLSA